jgi:hypothetical protein
MPEKKPTSGRGASKSREAEVVVEKCHESPTSKASGAGGGAVYGLGLIGAAVYYIQQASGFGEFLVACLKALVWPAFVVYDLLKHMGS